MNCVICTEAVAEPSIRFTCNHAFCLECLAIWEKGQGVGGCPACGCLMDAAQLEQLGVRCQVCDAWTRIVPGSLVTACWQCTHEQCTGCAVNLCQRHLVA